MTVHFDKYTPCDYCGTIGSYDFLGDNYCPNCAVTAIPPEELCMDKFYVTNEPCELCVKEYIKTNTDALSALPNNQEKTDKIHAIIKESERACSKPIVKFNCREQMFDNYAYHNLCVDHLYQMIDSIKKYEDESKDR